MSWNSILWDPLKAVRKGVGKRSVDSSPIYLTTVTWNRLLGGCERVAEIVELAGGNACPTLAPCGAGAFACQPTNQRSLNASPRSTGSAKHTARSGVRRCV